MTEVLTPTQTAAKWKAVLTDCNDSNQKIGNETNSTVDKYTITNAKVDSMSVTKRVSGTNHSTHTSVSPYSIDIVLTPPETSPNAMSAENLQTIAAAANSGKTFTLVESDTKVKTTVSLAADGTATINGLPYGTTYTVEEQAASKAGASSVVVGYIDDTNKKIGAGAADTVEVTNTYPELGSLKLTKTYSGDPPSTLKIDNDYYYTFDVTLATTGTLKLSDYNITWPAFDDTTHTGVTKVTASSNDQKYVFTATVKGNDTTGVTISGIPQGATYKVEETSASQAGSPSVNYSDGTNGEGTINGDKSVGVTNTYSGLNLIKHRGTNAASYGIGTDTPFTYHVTLKDENDAPLGSGVTINVSGGVGNSINSDDAKAAAGFDVAVSELHSVSISGMPAGTKYEVYEVKTGNAALATQTVMTNGAGGAVSTNPPEGQSQTASGKVNASGATTVEITNNYGNIGTLTLHKDYAQGTQSSTANDAVECYCQVGFKAPQGVTFDTSLNAYTVTAGKTVGTPTTGSVTEGEEPHTVAYSTLTYIVKVSHGTPVTITNLPYGTVYTVTELTGQIPNSDPPVNYMPSGWHYDSEQYGRVNHTIGDVDANNTNSYTAYNAQVGDLVLKKILDGAYAANGIKDKDDANPTQFTFNITLTPPGTMTAAQLKERYLGNSSDYTVVNNKLTRSVTTLKGNDTTGVTISGLPYGTTYTVEEDDSSKEKTSAVTPTELPASGHTAGHVDVASSTYSIKNTYPKLGSLVLGKTLETGTTDSPATSFTFTVKLENDGVDLKDFFDANASDITYTTDTDNNKNYKEHLIEFTFSITSADSAKTISGIPYGTLYTISEDEAEGWKQVTPASALTGTVTHATDNSVSISKSIKNAKIGDLKLTKTLAGNYAGYGVDNTATFSFDVELYPPSDGGTTMSLDDFKAYLTDANTYTEMPEGEVSKTYLKKTITEVPSNGTYKTISGLPYGTTYKVTEANQSALPVNTIVAVSDNADTTAGTMNAGTKTVTVTNTYPGSLELKKKLVNAPFNVTDDTVFKFSVTLTKGSGNITIKENGIAKTITSGTAFPVSVSVNETVTLTDVPIGATYKVTETQTAVTPSGTGTSITGQVTTAKTLTAESPTASEEITNTYAVTPKTVTLYKQDADSHEAIPGGQFYLLRLRDTTDINDPDVKTAFESGNILGTELKMTKMVEGTPTEVVIADVVTGITGAVDNVITTDAEGMILVDNITFNVGERYFFLEKTTENNGTTILDGSTPKKYVADNSITAAKVITINNAQDEYVVTYNNELVPTSTDIDAEKQDKDTGESLGGAVFDLFFKKVNIPQTYTVNDPFITPMQTLTRLITEDITPPDDNVTQTTTPGTTTYTYTEQSVPSASDKDWILPRTDSDYIYFRDYNTGTPGTEDTQSFDNTTSSSQGAAAQNGKRSWLWTGLADNVQHQSKEIDYTHNYWYAAQFSGNGKQQVQYAVWERFVDRYTDPSDRTSDTVVWKIQPPRWLHTGTLHAVRWGQLHQDNREIHLQAWYYLPQDKLGRNVQRRIRQKVLLQCSC